MNIILMSGGSGKRLWPLSNDIRSKQFIKLFKTENGTYESMVQRVYRQIHKVDSEANVIVATSKSQVSAIHNQLGEGVGVSVEPCRKDTFPAIALATAYLHDVKGIDEEDVVVVCPVDPYVEEEYFHALKELSMQAEAGEANLVLMGIEPTCPSEKYGYIVPQNKEHISSVVSFKEKPNQSDAEKYIGQGALWNGGVFAYKLKYVLDKAHEIIDFVDYYDLSEKYETLEKISFDYAVVEKEQKIQVVRFAGEWKDLGTWSSLTQALEEACVGKGILSEDCENVHIVNELDIPILAMGLKDVVVSAGADGILVADKAQSDQLKVLVDRLDTQTRFVEKSWGDFRILDISDTSIVNKILLMGGQRMSYHSHEGRDEVWVVLSGSGHAVIDEEEKRVSAGDVIKMHAGCRHTIQADTELVLIEVQLGKDIDVGDKQKFVMD